jgi:hypothetical protein
MAFRTGERGIKFRLLADGGTYPFMRWSELIVVEKKKKDKNQGVSLRVGLSLQVRPPHKSTRFGLSTRSLTQKAL